MITFEPGRLGELASFFAALYCGILMGMLYDVFSLLRKPFKSPWIAGIFDLLYYIAVVALEEAEPRFHARLNAKGKTYRYRIHQGPVPDVFGRRYSWPLTEQLDVEAMKAAAAYLVGKQDFQAFCDLKNSKKSTVRRVDSIEIFREGADLVLDFTGEGFLYHMVRIMAGTLADVGAHRILPGQIPGILAAKDRKQAGQLAPACGLMLMEVTY